MRSIEHGVPPCGQTLLDHLKSLPRHGWPCTSRDQDHPHNIHRTLHAHADDVTVSVGHEKSLLAEYLACGPELARCQRGDLNPPLPARSPAI